MEDFGFSGCADKIAAGCTREARSARCRGCEQNGRPIAASRPGRCSEWETLVEESRQRLRRMVAFRLDQRLQGRVDPSDVLQDAYLEAWKDLGSYIRLPTMPFFLWLRGIAGNKLRELHRHHLGTRMRDPRREVSDFR